MLCPQDELAEFPSAATKLLSQLAIGQKGRIEAICADAPSANLLSALGVLPGRTIVVEKFAPLGDPIAVLVAGQRISLRRADAADVTVRVWN